MRSKYSRALIISGLLVFGCTTDKPPVPEIQKPTHVNLIMPRVSLRWSEPRDADNLIATTMKGMMGANEEIYVSTEVIIDETQIDRVSAFTADDGQSGILLTLTPAGEKRTSDATQVQSNHRIALVVDGTVVSAARVHGPMGKYITLTGGFSEEEAEEIASRIEGLLPDAQPAAPVQNDAARVEEQAAESREKSDAQGARTPPQNDAARVVDQAIKALGGENARTFLRRGSVKMEIIGNIPGLSEKFGTDRLTFSAQFDLPEFERREICGDPAKDHMHIITNSGTVWIGNQHGVGQTMPAPPQAFYRGPFIIGEIQWIVEFKEAASRLELRPDILDVKNQVVEAFMGDEISGRVAFDKGSCLPVRIEKVFSDIQSNEMTETAHTITFLSEYEQFGSAKLPTRVLVKQDGIKALVCNLISADFDSPIDKSVFAIPN